MAIALPSLVGGGLGKQPGEGARDGSAGRQRDALSQHLCAGDREAAGPAVSLLSEPLPWALAVPSKGAPCLQEPVSFVEVAVYFSREKWCSTG